MANIQPFESILQLFNKILTFYFLAYLRPY